MTARRIAAVFLAVPPLLWVVIALVAARALPFAVTLYLVAGAAAVVAAVIGARARVTGAVPLAIASVGLGIAHAIWLFFAIVTASAGFSPPLPNCAQHGVAGPSHFESVIFPTALWCVAEDGGVRAPVTDPLTTVVVSLVMIVIVLAGAALAVRVWRRAD